MIECRDCKYFPICDQSNRDNCTEAEPKDIPSAVNIVTPKSLALLVTQTKDTNPKELGKVRTFETGATRDTTTGKLNYVKALSPIVMQRYVEYLGEHRTQSDGTQRDWDNWKNGIPKETYLEGEDRHHRAVWKLIQGFPAFDNYGPVTLEDSLCGVIFNSMGMLHEILKEKQSVM